VVNQQLVASRTVPFPCDLIRSLFPALNQERDSSFLITPRGPIFRGLFSTRSTVTCCMGVEILGVTAGEAAQPEKPIQTIPRAMRTVLLRLILFYVLSIIVMLLMTQWDRMGSGITGSPFVLGFAAAGIPFAASIMSLVIITAALSSANTNLYLITRTLFSLSRDGYVSARLGRLGRNGVPYFALLASTGGMVAAILLAIFCSRTSFPAAPRCCGRRNGLRVDRYPTRTPCLSPIAWSSARRSATDPSAVCALLADSCSDRSRRHHDRHFLSGGSAIYSP
jgi:hypothetical protein